MAALIHRESSFCEKDYYSEILKGLCTQRHNKTFCDVVMKVCGCELHLHSPVLAAASPYFNHFLTLDSPRHFSQRSPQMIEIQIEGSDANSTYKDAVETIINFLYTGEIEINSESVTHISELARIMQIKRVVKYCEDFVVNRNDSSLAQDTESPGGTTDAGVSTEADAPNTTSKTNGHPNVLPDSTRPMVAPGTVAGLPRKLFKHGRLVSVATQVTPNLLGISPPSPKKTRESKTQTLAKDFPEKVKAQDSGRIGRRKSAHVGEDTEIVLEITRSSQKSASVRLLPHTKGTGSLSCEDEENEKEKVSLDPEEKRGANENNHLENFTVVECGDNIGVVVETENEELDGINNPRRRSGRRPKPTPKILALKRTATSPLKGGPLKVRQVVTTDEKLEEDAPATKEDSTEDSPRKSPRKSKLVPREERIYLVGDDPKTGESETVLEGIEIKEENLESDEQLKELILYTGHDPDPEPKLEARKPLRKAKRPVPRKNRKAHYRFSCSECDFRTNKVREFTSHKRLHKMENNICYYCEEKFENKDDLTEHFGKHKGPLPYFCPVCDCRFKSRTQLNIHLPKHSDDKPFVCEVCSTGFKWKHALKSHMIVHSNRKDHLCDECGYATAHKCQLKAHKLIHTGQTYRCSFSNCRFQATKRQNLKYHILTHTREKPHQCEICGQSFSLIKNMRRHMLLHSNDKRHHCNECDFSTTRYDKLKEHKLKSHGMGSPPEKRVRVADLVQQNLVLGEDEEENDLETHEEVEEVEEEEGEEEVENIVPQESTSVVESEPMAIQPQTIVQAPVQRENEEVAMYNETHTMQFLPGQTIIITQTGQDGELETHEVTLPPPVPQGLVQVPMAGPVQVQNGVQFTEVMIPSTHLNEYVQELTFVGPT